MGVAIALAIAPEPVLHVCLYRAQMDVPKTTGIPLEPVLQRCLRSTQMDVAETLGILQSLSCTDPSERYKWMCHKQ